MKIIIDIGHAGGTGAWSTDKKWEEHDVCTGLAWRLRGWLKARGVEVVLVDFPDESNAADLRKTAEAANAVVGVQCGISLHMDAGPVSARGGHVCYYSKKGKELAEGVAEGLCRVLPGRAEKVVRRTDLYVLRHTKPVWALVECGFITNEGDLELVMREPEVVGAIGEGILKFLNK